MHDWIPAPPFGFLCCFDSMRGIVVRFLVRSRPWRHPGWLSAAEVVLPLTGCWTCSGSVVSYPVTSDNRTLGPDRAALVQHKGGSGVNAARQEGPHCHQALLDPADGGHLLVPDLGADRVVVYAVDDKGGMVARSQLVTAPGSGPRHAAFSSDGTVCYVLCELASTVTACKWDGETLPPGCGSAALCGRIWGAWELQVYLFPTLADRSCTSEYNAHPFPLPPWRAQLACCLPSPPTRASRRAQPREIALTRHTAQPSNSQPTATTCIVPTAATTASRLFVSKRMGRWSLSHTPARPGEPLATLLLPRTAGLPLLRIRTPELW